MIAPRRLLALAAACALLVPASARADFGLVPGSVTVTARNANSTVATQAGSHPANLTVHFELKTDESGKSEGGQMRNALIDLPQGLIGNPQAIPTCSRQDFEGFSPHCAGESQVGTLRVILPGLGELNGPVYNVEPPPGVAAQLGFSGGGFLSQQYASVRSEEGYGLRVGALNTPTEVTQVTETIWGCRRPMNTKKSAGA